MGIRPTAGQLEFLDWEFGVFFHFGLRTFYEGHQDWDSRPMEAAAFCPEQLDCDSWIRTIKAAGARYAVLVCKHHDGFANWPSAYSDFSVAHTPWKNGKGDVVKEFTDACRRQGIHIGLYYSPAEAGYTQRTPAEYDDYFIRQIRELLCGYGRIDYLWFDGCGSEGHRYDEKRIIGEIRRCQPDIRIFNMWDPDTRWVGNEAGVASVDNANVVSGVDFSIRTREKEDLNGRRFLPAECDCMMRWDNWFNSEYDVHTVKSVEELIGLYYHSVGNGANLLLNVSPDRRGLLPETDAARLLEFGEEIRRRFSSPLPGRVTFTGDGVTVELEEEQLINQVVLAEDLTDGEAIEGFAIQVRARRIYEPLCVYRGSRVGHKRVITFPPIRAAEVWVTVTGSQGEWKLAAPAVYYVK